MSLVGFKAQNHPQQRTKDHVDDRGTTWEMFNPLHERFGFTLDVAAAPHNAKLPRYFTREDDGLAQSWAGERVWCNPPYSDLGAWTAKAWDEFGWRHETCSCGHAEQHHMTRDQSCTWGYCDCRGWATAGRAGLIVMLLPANRTEQAWWQRDIEPYRDRLGTPLRVEFLAGRPRFDRPDAVIGPKGDRPPFGCCLAIWEAAS